MRKPKNLARNYFNKVLIHEDNIFCYYFDGNRFEKQIRPSCNKIERHELTKEDYALMVKIGYDKIYASKTKPIPKHRPKRSYDLEVDFGRAGLGLRAKSYIGWR